MPLLPQREHLGDNPDPDCGILAFSSWADKAITMAGKPVLPLMLRLELMTRNKVFKHSSMVRLGHIALPVPGTMNSHRCGGALCGALGGP